MAEADDLGAESCGIAARQGQCRISAREIQGMGLGCVHRNLLRAVPDSQRSVRRARRAHALQGALERAGDRGRRTSTQTKDELPPYNVYGADGDVTAELVYVNQGMPDDYKELEREGISVKGKIALTRYGGGWRGLKPKLAYEHGAVGCLIYSDPRDDGYGAGDVYPEGRLSAPRCRAARLGAGSDLVQRRSADSRRRSGSRSEAAGTERCQDLAEDSRIADLLRGCASLCSRRSAGGSRRRRGAAACRLPITSVPDRLRCT